MTFTRKLHIIALTAVALTQCLAPHAHAEEMPTILATQPNKIGGEMQLTSIPSDSCQHSARRAMVVAKSGEVETLGCWTYVGGDPKPIWILWETGYQKRLYKYEMMSFTWADYMKKPITKGAM